jgi:hypothetical protein
MSQIERAEVVCDGEGRWVRGPQWSRSVDGGWFTDHGIKVIAE